MSTERIPEQLTEAQRLDKVIETIGTLISWNVVELGNANARALLDMLPPKSQNQKP